MKTLDGFLSAAGRRKESASKYGGEKLYAAQQRIVLYPQQSTRFHPSTSVYVTPPIFREKRRPFDIVDPLKTFPSPPAQTPHLSKA